MTSKAHRSHFGSRYKLGCCGHASLLGRGSNPTGLGFGHFPEIRGPVFSSFWAPKFMKKMETDTTRHAATFHFWAPKLIFPRSCPPSWGDPSGHPRGYRSHFGSRYKLGCCGHASLLGRGSNPTGLGFGLFQKFGAPNGATFGPPFFFAQIPIFVTSKYF